MNIGLLNMIIGKDRKIYKDIISLIEQKNILTLMNLDSDQNFGLTSSKYVDSIIKRLEEEVVTNPAFLVDMNRYSYHRTNYFNEYAIRQNPRIIENLIDNNIRNIDNLILMAFANGYMPTNEYIEKHTSYFSAVDIMKKLVDMGYKPTSECIESDLGNTFCDEELFMKALDWGYVPSLQFISRNKLLRNSNLIDRILDVIELTPELINSSIFYGNALAQRKIITKKPELLFDLYQNNETFEQFWLEAIKLGYIPDEIIDNYYIVSNYLIFSRIVKQRPEMVKYCEFGNKEQRDQVDELAICMGYVPTLDDVKTSDYVQKSPKLMEAVIKRRPEAIKYVEKRPLSGAYSLNISINEFSDLAHLAILYGYIPSLNDIENNPRLIDSFDIMKVLIKENPFLINRLRDLTPNKEELLKIAIQNGFDGKIEKDDLLLTETAIMYKIDNNEGLSEDVRYNNNYSLVLYRYLINKGYKVKDIIFLFNGNYDVMMEIISHNPEYIVSLSETLPRNKIDELGMMAINGGYQPKFEDKIFGYGLETAKMMVRKWPSYIQNVNLKDRLTLFFSKPCDAYDEICKIAVDGGFLPDVSKIGNGDGNLTLTVYNASYDIMKKVIPIKPDIIECCTVEDKDKYDELCRLALSCGYKVINDSVITKSESKMCSNYDIMAEYIKSHPDKLPYIQFTNPDEIMRIIDIAINSGFSLKTLNANQLLRLFLPIAEEMWSNYLDDETIITLRKAKVLYATNDEVSMTVNAKFLADEISGHFTKLQVEILSCYPKLQEKILNLADDPFRASIIYELVDKYQNNLEWVTILEKALNNIFSNEYTNLIEDIKGKELTKEDKNNLIYLLITNNHLDISCLDELENIDSIRNKYIDILIARNSIESLKTAYLEKVFGIDLSTAINLVKLYGNSLESSAFFKLDDKDKEELYLLANMKKIINLDNYDVLKYYVDNVNPEFVVKPDLMVTYENRLKYLFTREFNKSFTKPNEEDKVKSNLSDEQDLDIYLAAGNDGTKKWRMMITSIGAYTSMSEPDDYYANWNMGKIASHGCCCSYIGEKNIGTAEVKYCCLGFSDYELGALQLSGPYDLNSSSTEESYQIASSYSSMFLLPDDILDNTRHTHNETVWERRNISNNVTFKKQPTYIVYFVDNFSDRLINEEARRQWESAKKAAVNFAIEENGKKKALPIMVVEREKIAKSQLDNILNNLNRFKESLDMSLIKDIVVDYESNYAGNREYHLNILEKYFPKHENLVDSVVGKLIEIIKSIDDYDTFIKCVVELENVVRSEQMKYSNTEHGANQAVPSFNIDEALLEIGKLKSMFGRDFDSTLSMINNCDGNDRQFYKSDTGSMNENMLEEQLSTNEVVDRLNNKDLVKNIVKYENEIKGENINCNLKIHGQRHVKDVLLYTTLIGNGVLEDKHDLELVMLAAKYHDVGRTIDAFEEHALNSAEKAKSLLGNKCSKDDLAIIDTIIGFHEVPRNGGNADELFEELARTNGIPASEVSRVRLMAEVLRDADALDRTRFINMARLNPELLQFDVSKKLVKFASSLQEAYAINDLKEFGCEEAITVLLQNYTPQEVLRVIRHSNKNLEDKERIQNFINLWASSTLSCDEGVIKVGK